MHSLVNEAVATAATAMLPHVLAAAMATETDKQEAPSSPATSPFRPPSVPPTSGLLSDTRKARAEGPRQQPPSLLKTGFVPCTMCKSPAHPSNLCPYASGTNSIVDAIKKRLELDKMKQRPDKDAANNNIQSSSCASNDADDEEEEYDTLSYDELAKHAAALHTHVMALVTSLVTRQLRLPATMILFQLEGFAAMLRVLVDSGASHSCMHKDVTTRFGLRITEPAGPVRQVTLGDPTHRVNRLGVVQDVVVKIHYMLGAHPSVVVRKSFEVMNMSYDFILGVDMFAVAFPSDSINNFLIPSSPLGSTPAVLLCDLTPAGERVPLAVPAMTISVPSSSSSSSSVPARRVDYPVDSAAQVAATDTANWLRDARTVGSHDTEVQLAAMEAVQQQSSTPTALFSAQQLKDALDRAHAKLVAYPAGLPPSQL